MSLPPAELRKIREDLLDVIARSIATGLRIHPLLTKKGRERLAVLRAAATRLSPRGEYASRILGEVSSQIDPATILLVNHALQVLIPDFALLFEEAIQEAKFRVGAATSNVESSAEEFLLSPGGILMFGVEAVAIGLAAGEALSQRGDQVYGKIRDLDLGHFDAPEDALPGLPAIERSTGGELLFRCPECAALRRRPFEEAGASFPCGCGEAVRVPIPSLRRTAQHLKEKREAEQGIVRCRVCRGVTQTGRGGVMAAGYCSTSCARQGLELFREHVPRSSRRDGDAVVFACHCAASLRAVPDMIGSRVPCPQCGLDVWVPEPERARPERGVVRCAHCGRNAKARAARCLYCGKPPIS